MEFLKGLTCFLLRWARLFFGRHFTAVDAVMDFYPDVEGFRGCWVEGKVGQVEATFLGVSVVAVEAVAFEECVGKGSA